MTDEQHSDATQNKHALSAIELPNFDELVALARLNPDALEALRIRLCNQVIDSSHERNQRRLKGLLFKINSIRAQSKSSIGLCVKLAEMMNDSLHELNLALTQPHLLLQERLHTCASHTAQIIPFPKQH